MKYLISFILCLLAFTSCVDEEQYSDTPRGNFEALWKIMDQHYCFFDYKKQVYGLDWNSIYDKYKVRIYDGMNDDRLFEVLGDMLGELRDGHVNMYSSSNVARNWSFQEDYPSNFIDTLQRAYIGTNYRMTCGIKYTILDDNIGYMYIGTMENSIGSGNIDDILSYFELCNGIIIDVRENGGGLIDNAEILASHFTNKELLVGYMQHKTGTGHSDFSAMQEQVLKPSSGLRWQKSAVVLTNRKVFSATNEFVKYMKCCDKVSIVGDRTGGGAGLPLNSEIPNGWNIRFSACPMYDKDKQSTEFGIDPDYKVDINKTDFLRNKDTIIEYARSLILKGKYK